MSALLEAPMLAGSRPRAQQIFAGLEDNLRGVIVQLDCGALVAATESFADEVLLEVLVRRHADQLVVMNVSDDEFVTYLNERAEHRGVLDRLQIFS